MRHSIRRGLVVVGVLLVAVSVPAQVPSSTPAPPHTSSRVRVIALPRELEVRLAVDALPPTLRDEATVLALDGGQYVTARRGRNPFTCLVSRRGGNLYPVCFDEEGTRTILPAYVDDAILRVQGKTAEDVERTLAKGFEEGRYRPPGRAGVAYMLSPATYMFEDGRFVASPPHTMFYAPFLTSAEIGGVPGRSAFVDRPGPHGMIIVLAGERERVELAKASEALVAEVERHLGLR